MKHAQADGLMTAIVLRAGDTQCKLSVERCPKPSPNEDEVLIEIQACSLNYVDIRQRKGLIATTYPVIPGREVAGNIVAKGKNVRRWHQGDKVCALLPSGGYAQFACAKADLCLPIPKTCDDVSAAALPQSVFTAWWSLFKLGRLQAGEKLLVHGGAGGVGTAAIQLASKFGAFVIATVGSEEKSDVCVKLGADRVVNHRKDDLVISVQEFTSGAGVDVILDVVGSSAIQPNLDVAGFGSRIISIGFMSGSHAAIDLEKVAQKRVMITGGLLRDLSSAEKIDLARDIEGHVWPLIERGFFVPVIDRMFPMHEVIAAQQRMESRAHIGKIVLIPTQAAN